ncbi:uncharacterized protein [Parasteatoda tepidariorum]|uniref:uncharacterized protein n=1 Tax=Parasteatoda tepidariorum TaxID=114398 RepID=UPI0039BD00FE
MELPWELTQVQTLDVFNNLTKGQTTDVIYQQTFKSHREEYSDYKSIYTDGCKSEGHTASGVKFPDCTISEKLHPNCSVFTAESHAILLALQYILTQKRTKLFIYSDSKSCIAALHNQSPNPHSIFNKILDTYDNLLQDGHKVTFCWIPGHTNVTGNEVANSIAKLTNNLSNNPLTNSDVKKSIQNILESQWQNCWKNETNNKLHAMH